MGFSFPASTAIVGSVKLFEAHSAREETGIICLNTY